MLSSLDGLKHFLDIFQENISAINAFDVSDRSEFQLFFVTSRVLNSSTKCLFLSEFKSEELPIVDDILKFVQSRCKNVHNSTHVSPMSVSKSSKPVFSLKKCMPLSRTSLLTPEQYPCCSHCQKIYEYLVIF